MIDPVTTTMARRAAVLTIATIAVMFAVGAIGYRLGHMHRVVSKSEYRETVYDPRVVNIDLGCYITVRNGETRSVIMSPDCRDTLQSEACSD